MGPPQMMDHWAREQTWPRDRRLWAFYVTCGAITPFVDYAQMFQEQLSRLPGLDVVEPRWLHMTVLGVGFVDEVEPAVMARLVDQAASLVDGEAPIDMVAQAPRARVDAVWLSVDTTPSLIPLRERLREAVVECLGREPHALPAPSGGFRPHISIAYTGADAPTNAEVDDRLRLVDVPPAEFRVSHLSLLPLRRQAPRWFWDEERRLPFHGAEGNRREASFPQVVP
ncbi:MAG: 2'-5' RNA ligase family protein [Knoellia sp.]